MQEGDLVKIDLLVEYSGSRKSKEAWCRIKKDFEELAQQTSNGCVVCGCTISLRGYCAGCQSRVDVRNNIREDKC